MATHTFNAETIGYRQLIPGGFSATFGTVSVIADDYVIGIQNGTAGAQDSFFVRFTSDLNNLADDPMAAPVAPLMVNGTPEPSGGRFDLNLIQLSGTLYMDNSLPATLTLGNFDGFNSGTFSDTPSGAVDVLYTVATVQPAAVMTPVNAAPVAADDAYSFPADQPATVNAAAGVLDNDTDADGESLTAAVVSPPSSANSFTLSPDGSFSYSPNIGFVGTDSFTYVANDGSLDSATATVTITVTNPLACLDQLAPVADAYRTFAATEVAQAGAAIQSLQQSGDFAGADARVSSSSATLTQEADAAAQIIMDICATCISDVQSQGLNNLIPQIQAACLAQLQAIGQIQATSISQLEGALLPRGDRRPPRFALLLLDRSTDSIRQQSQSTTASVRGYIRRYLAIIRRHVRRGNMAAAADTEAMALQVIQQTVAARTARIQDVAATYQTRVSPFGDSVQILIDQVNLAASTAVNRMQQVEADATLAVQSATP